jgi:hypothetical protein
MKLLSHIFISILCLSTFNLAKAQTQHEVYLAPDPQTARWSYIETDNNGKQIATIYYSVGAIKGNGVNGNLKLLVQEVPVAHPEDTTKSFHFYRFKDGEFMADVMAGFEDNLFGDDRLDSLVINTVKEKYPDLPKEKQKELYEQAKARFLNVSGETRGIPRYPKVGKLPDYEFRCKISIISMKILGQDRKIVGTERIQTEAGVFDCYILEETITTKSMMMKDVEKIRSWYAYGIGLVKEVTYDKNGKLVSTMILNEITDIH